MADYRTYFLDAAGHIRHAQEFECDNDEDAIAVVAALEHRPLELWQRGRVVKEFPLAGKPATDAPTT